MGETEIIRTGCSHDCGGRCILKVHVEQGRIVCIETDDRDEPQLRACLRGRAYRQRVYAPDRVQYPLKRTGERGAGEFERVSWDEALDTVARELIRVRDKSGNASILYIGGTGSQAALHHAKVVEDMLAGFGGFTRPWGEPSFEGALFASMATFGTLATGNSREDLLNSRLIIMWGWNPAVTVWDTNTGYILAQAREKGIRIISIDPRFTSSAAVFAGEWIPIRPSTDTAMLLAMAYVIIRDGLQDQKFLDRYTVGFDRFRRYVVGDEDGIPRTPAWAEQITGVPSATIERLVGEYATSKPAALIPGWGPARSAMGEQFSRAASTLSAMTGNIGVSGGYAGGFMRAFRPPLPRPRGARNAVEQGTPPRRNSLYKLKGAGSPTSARIHNLNLYDAILRGKAGGYPADLKLAYIVGCNLLASRPNTTRGIEALKKLNFIVVHEQRMTPTARFADILLPVNTFMERDDIIVPWLGAPYYLYLNRAVEPMYESRTDREICVDLAPRLGITDYGEGKSDEEWLHTIAGWTGNIPDYDRFRLDGVIDLGLPEPFVAFKEQIEDPENHPFPTLSGKIEICCDHLAEMDNHRIPPVAKYLPVKEGHEDPLLKEYPLQMITSHHLPAVHSTLEGIPWLEEAGPRLIWLNTADAEQRGIADGDEVLVYNGRGRVLVRAYVTECIMPGVVDLPEGAWFDIGPDGLDRGGCANLLSPDEPSPGGAWPVNTVLVEVKRA